MFADGVGGSSSTTTKFRLVGGAQPLILLPIHVNGEGPFDFILDTGAGISLLSAELAERLQVKPIGSKEGFSAGGKVLISLARVDSLALGGTILNKAEVAVHDLTRIGRTIGARIDGDLGYNFLRHFRFTIDYGKNELRLEDPKRCDYVGASALTETPIRLAARSKPLILVDTYINGEGPFQFAIDTGTSTSAIKPELAKKFNVHEVPIGPVTTGSEQITLTAGTVEGLQVGGAKIGRVDVVIGPFLSMLSKAAEAELDGIIGYNFLRNFKVMLDYPNLTLSLFSA